MKTLLVFSIGVAIGSAITYQIIKNERENRFKEANQRFAEMNKNLSDKDRMTLEFSKARQNGHK